MEKDAKSAIIISICWMKYQFEIGAAVNSHTDTSTAFSHSRVMEELKYYGKQDPKAKLLKLEN